MEKMVGPADPIGNGGPVGARSGGQAVGLAGIPPHPAAAALPRLVGGHPLLAPAPAGIARRRADCVARPETRQPEPARRLDRGSAWDCGERRGRIAPPPPRPVAFHYPLTRLHLVYPIRRAGLVRQAPLRVRIGDQWPYLGTAPVVQP